MRNNMRIKRIVQKSGAISLAVLMCISMASAALASENSDGSSVELQNEANLSDDQIDSVLNEEQVTDQAAESDLEADIVDTDEIELQGSLQESEEDSAVSPTSSDITSVEQSNSILEADNTTSDTPAASEEPKVGFVTEGDDTYYYYENGKYYANKLFEVNKKKYYADNNGHIKTGVFKYNGSFYYADNSGIIKTSAGWITWNGKKYYANSNGVLYHDQQITFGSSNRYYMGSDAAVSTGVIKIGSDYVYADPNNGGKIQIKAGWITWKGKKYFCNGKGVLYRNQLITFGPSTRYYMGSNAAVATGVIKTSSGYVYADPNNGGKIQIKAGWITWNGKKYFCNGNGYLYANRLITFGSSTRYYMGADAAVAKGVFRTSSGVVFADPNNGGKIQIKAGWVTWNGKKYFCNGNGYLYANRLITFGSSTRYYMGADATIATGVIRTSSGIVYADPNNGGKIQIKAGWVTWNGKKYFCNGNGYLYANRIISFGKTRYYMDSNGTIAFGLLKVGNRFYRADSKTGVLSDVGSGWVKYNGKSYYVSSNGTILANQWKKIGSRWYHFTSTGYCDLEQSSAPLDSMGQKAQGYSSNTSYLILVDRDNHRVAIYSGSIWNWTPIKSFSCGNGKDSTPTITGEFSIPSKYPRSQPYFDSGSARCWYPTRIYGGYLFHSVLYYPASGPYSIMDGRLGVGVSHGCIRLALENAEWIYDNIPLSTKVVIY